MSNLVENNQDLLRDTGERLRKFLTPGLICSLIWGEGGCCQNSPKADGHFLINAKCIETRRRQQFQVKVGEVSCMFSVILKIKNSSVGSSFVLCEFGNTPSKCWHEGKIIIGNRLSMKNQLNLYLYHNNPSIVLIFKHPFCYNLN